MLASGTCKQLLTDKEVQSPRRDCRLFSCAQPRGCSYRASGKLQQDTRCEGPSLHLISTTCMQN